MDANQLPSQEQAEHGLAQVAASRRAVIAATTRPAWADALLAGVWYAVLRWEERYQNRRLAAGDYHRFDLL